ncbi:TRAP transporter small permease subunit [Thermanaerovibrio acidaminovorans]|uniref:Tripartite ATP-independent periplasmic transporter DctQ component n=1 Tax=Thermanaerovibrio acidaminovorans (strain ATCC 49978 / DSM 6589 / Su883) TaxID=525903 RepID=D1B6P4_THEAS|nr:TRAP transporter small permease [Thermanaerovibrio acidaminovorans]ACZ19685.1 Tripartite ATP-independent periplasmic transporter DctQ component [Thermanaerovibrio acidaminovorans DSM 6589]
MNFIDGLSRSVGRCLMYLTLAVVAVVVYGVTVRYFVGRADVRAMFLSVWMYGIMFVVGGAYTLLEGGHVSVDIVYNRLPKPLRKALDVLNLGIIALCCGVILYINLPIAYDSYIQREVDSSLGVVFAPPIWWLKWVPVLGVALMGAQALSLLVHRFKDREAAEGGER